MVEKLAGEATIELTLKAGPGGKYFPMLVITKNGNLVEAALTLHGFKYKDDAEKVINATKVILSNLIEEDEGTEL